MSIKDELERASKERSIESKQHAKDVKQTRELLKGKLDTIFSNLSLEMRSRNDLFINTLISVNAVNLLNELCKECNLVHSTVRDNQEQKDKWGRVSHVSAMRNIPAKLEICLHSASSDYKGEWRKSHSERVYKNENGKEIRELPNPLRRASQDYSVVDCLAKIDPNTTSNLHSALADYTTWHSYQFWSKLVMSEWDIIDNFPKAIRDFETAVKTLEIPPLESIHVQLTWDYVFHAGGEYQNDWETYQRVSVNIDSQVVEVSRDGGIKVSIPIDNCTSDWVKQQIANVYIKYGRLS